MEKISKFKTITAYAEAWLMASKDAGVLDKIFQEAKSLSEVLTKDAQLWSYLSVPVDDNKEKTEIISAVAKAGKLSTITTEMLKVMAENNRLNLVFPVIEEFMHLYYKDKKIKEVFVKTAQKLSDKQDKKLKKVLEEKLDSPIVVEYEIDENVIGGLHISFDSYLIDDTIKGKLDKIKQVLFVN